VTHLELDNGSRLVGRRMQLVAEFAVLNAYDELRRRAGYDYGNGQRVAELNRRRRFLVSRGAGELVDRDDLLEVLSAEELVDAFERVGRPRLERARRQPRGDGSPVTIRTWETLRASLRATSLEVAAS
jgi:hypothetical protein